MGGNEWQEWRVEPWVTVLIAVVTVLTALLGWLVSRVFTLAQIVSTQRDTIDALNRQLDRIQMTAEITNQVLAALPLPRGSGGTER